MEETPPPDFRRLFEGAPDPYLVLTPALNIVAVNEAYCRATSIKREHALGRHVFDVFPDNPDDPSATGVSNLRASLMRVLQFRQADMMATQKYAVRRAEAEGGGFEVRHWAQINSPVLDSGGQISWIIHRAEDVTDVAAHATDETSRTETMRTQQNLIEQLRNTKRFLDAVVENLPGMLFVKSFPDCRFVLFNRAGEELLGYSSQDFLGKSDYDFFPKEQADHFVASDLAILRAGVPIITSQEAIQTRYRGERLLRTIKVPVLDEAGNPEYLLGLSEDITDQKMIEQQLRQAVKMEAVGQLTGGVAHDFNNLLGVIVGNLDMALEKAAQDPELSELIRDALTSALKGSDLTRRLLAFSRKQPLRPIAVDLNQSLPHIATMLRRTLGEDVDIDLQPSGDLWAALADSAQIDEAVLNLAINARDAMPRGGKLSIETANLHLDEDYANQQDDVKPGDYVMLSVSDTGCGMSPEILEHCFEPFYTTKETDKGTGLGLSMVYGFVKQSGGHIKIYSEVGYGTSVKMFFPRASISTVAAVEPFHRPMLQADGELILAVEDNADLRTVTVKQLKELGYRVLEANDAKMALTILAEHPDVKLLFTDIVMPGGMTGTELAQEVRDLYPEIKILLTSGYTARAMANGSHDIASHELLLKPFRKTDLAVRLRQLLDT
jgi:PAS domain S-box-containing protein